MTEAKLSPVVKIFENIRGFPYYAGFVNGPIFDSSRAQTVCTTRKSATKATLASLCFQFAVQIAGFCISISVIRELWGKQHFGKVCMEAND